jgi:hypothetical protein
MSLSLRILFCWSILSAAYACHAQSPYLPDSGKGTVTVGYSYSTYDAFYDSKKRNSLKPFGIDSIDQHAATLNGEYSFAKNWAADLTVGYVTETMTKSLRPQDPRTSEGLNDTTVGVRYRALDETLSHSAWVPTLTLRAAAIVEGSYDRNFINSPGDGGTGGEYGLLMGRYWEKIGGGIYGSALHRIVSGGAPQKFKGTLGVYKILFKSFTLDAGYERIDSFGGVNFDSPTFTLNRFSELAEKSDTVHGGVGYRDSGERSYNVTVSKVIAGQNTSDRLTVQAVLSIPF